MYIQNTFYDVVNTIPFIEREFVYHEKNWPKGMVG